ncbi:MAG TPA: hypothetical protein VHP58_03815 [Alphaproteobacteria bacterium]|nr:hypothetical protein [Alphaproteobacteria bacterium]
MSLPTGSSLLRATAFTCGVIIISTAAYLQWQHRQKPAETITPLVFQPLTGVLADRSIYVIGADTGISVTGPVNATYASIAITKSMVPPAQSGTPNAAITHSDGMGGAPEVAIPGAYAVRLENPGLCKGNSCPVAVLAKSSGDNLVDNTILMTDTASMSVSSVKTNGNPDIIVDPNGDGKTVRLWWDSDDIYPHYSPLPKPGER